MPVLDKNSAAQNILSTKGTKQVSASTKGNFDTVLKQTTEAGRQDTDPGKKAETVKPAEKKTEETDSNKPAAESGRTEEKAGGWESVCAELAQCGCRSSYGTFPGGWG